MLPPRPPRSLTASRRLYRILLRLYPAAFRRHHGAAMEQLFRDSCRDAYAERGFPGLLVAWGHALGDLGRTALREHRDAIGNTLKHAFRRSESLVVEPIPRPAPGTQVRVIPVVQKQARPPWSLTLVSLENWDGVCIANFGLAWAIPGGQEPVESWGQLLRGLHPGLDLRITDDRGNRYRARQTSGAGGSTPHGGRMDLGYTLLPSLPEGVRALRFAVRVQLLGHVAGKHGLVPLKTERDGWAFTVAIPPTTAPS
jgi:hypothetical protein